MCSITKFFVCTFIKIECICESVVVEVSFYLDSCLVNFSSSKFKKLFHTFFLDLA